MFHCSRLPPSPPRTAAAPGSRGRPRRSPAQPALPGRYLDLAVEEAGALHDLLRGHLQHLLADAILRGHNGSVTPGPARPRRPQPRRCPSPPTRPTPTPSLPQPATERTARRIPGGRFRTTRPGSSATGSGTGGSRAPNPSFSTAPRRSRAPSAPTGRTAAQIMCRICWRGWGRGNGCAGHVPPAKSAE